MKTAGIFVVLLLIGAIMVGVVSCVNQHTPDYVQVKVLSKEDNKNNGYMFYTDIETFVNHDEMWKGKFDSSDYYRLIQPDTEYCFRAMGWRSGPLSTWRNVIGFIENTDAELCNEELFVGWERPA